MFVKHAMLIYQVYFRNDNLIKIQLHNNLRNMQAISNEHHEKHTYYLQIIGNCYLTKFDDAN